MPASPAPFDMARALLREGELRREPAEDELEQLNRVVQGATAEFRRRLKSGPYAS